MDDAYRIDDVSHIASPALVFYPALIRRNIATALEIAGDPSRLRPHVKTHKTREIVNLEAEAGITKHKCATIAEAEMLATSRADEILLAYPLVGPNVARFAQLVVSYPCARFAAVVENVAGAQALSEALTRFSQEAEVLVDLDVGQHRTGIPPGEEAVHLYERVATLPGLIPGGLHVYDGHNHQETLVERMAAVEELMESVLQLRETLQSKGLPVPRLVVGGTPTFPMFALMDIPGLECSPGTCFLHDHGYGTRFGDLTGFTPAALLLTRVISRPTPERITLDLGTKAVASDPPAGHRCHLIDVPDARVVVHNEEHLVIETPHASRFSPGDALFAIPTHICPTCALHRYAQVVENGKVLGRWEIAARDRVLTV